MALVIGLVRNGAAAHDPGNGVATVVISRWESELDVERLNKVMAHPVALGEAFEEQPG